MEINNKLEVFLDSLAVNIVENIEFRTDEEQDFFIENVVTILIESDEDSFETNLSTFLNENYDNPEELKETLTEGFGDAMRGLGSGIGKVFKGIGKGIGSAIGGTARGIGQGLGAIIHGSGGSGPGSVNTNVKTGSAKSGSDAKSKTGSMNQATQVGGGNQEITQGGEEKEQASKSETSKSETSKVKKEKTPVTASPKPTPKPVPRRTPEGDKTKTQTGGQAISQKGGVNQATQVSKGGSGTTPQTGKSGKPLSTNPATVARRARADSRAGRAKQVAGNAAKQATPPSGSKQVIKQGKGTNQATQVSHYVPEGNPLIEAYSRYLNYKAPYQ